MFKNIALSTMAFFSSQKPPEVPKQPDPRTIHHQCEEHIAKQAVDLGWKRVKDNAAYIGGGLLTNGSTILAFVTGKGVARKDLGDSTGGTIVEEGAHIIDAPFEPSENTWKRDQEIASGMFPDRKTAGKKLAKTAVNTVLTMGALKETVNYGCDVYFAKQKQNRFAAWKEEASKKYDAGMSYNPFQG